jgi:hypothetical protein
MSLESALIAIAAIAVLTRQPAPLVAEHRGSPIVTLPPTRDPAGDRAATKQHKGLDCAVSQAEHVMAAPLFAQPATNQGPRE